MRRPFSGPSPARPAVCPRRFNLRDGTPEVHHSGRHPLESWTPMAGLVGGEPGRSFRPSTNPVSNETGCTIHVPCVNPTECGPRTPIRDPVQRAGGQSRLQSRSVRMAVSRRGELRVFLGVPGPESFARRPRKVAVDMPHEEYVWLVDLDEDGKRDVLMQDPSAPPRAESAVASPPFLPPHSSHFRRHTSAESAGIPSPTLS